MKVTSFFHAAFFNEKVILKVNDQKDLLMIRKLFESKESREKRSGKEILVEATIDAAFQKRSFKQNNAVWKLVTIIFETENGRKPSHEELYECYCDLLDVYAPQRVNKRTGQLRRVHVSEGNTVEIAELIDGLLFHLATLCNLKPDLQADVRSVIYEYTMWKAKNKIEYLKTLEDVRNHIVWSEASGRRENIEIHHIVSRGACPQFVDCAWNLLVLTRDEHRYFHEHGWTMFLDKYPHLRTKVEMAFSNAGMLTPVTFMNAA